MAEVLSDQQARERIIEEFYKHYLELGLYVLVDAHLLTSRIDLDEAQSRRCLDYLGAKGLIRQMTVDGDYSPTVALVDLVEKRGSTFK